MFDFWGVTMKKAAFTYEIVQHIATLAESGYRTKELNLVSYDGAAPKFDLRLWMHFDTGAKMGKGITLTQDELLALRDVLNDVEVL